MECKIYKKKKMSVHTFIYHLFYLILISFKWLPTRMKIEYFDISIFIFK